MLRPSVMPKQNAGSKVLAGLIWRIKKRLRQMEPGITAGANDFWECFCVQVQTEGIFLEGYKDIVQKEMKPILARLAVRQRLALWLETDDGGWVRRHEKAFGLDELLPKMDAKTLESYVMEGVLYEAMNYSNARIRLITRE